MTRDADPLWEELGELLARTDPVPPDVLRTARAVFAWRALAAQIAALAPADQPPGRSQGWKAFPTDRSDGPSPG
ncbi:MAG TPA: hypothetical protein VHO93_10110 [Actinomycetota bacterium]|jgi:hypothetical protein|nr:hypothetical protein [Actinomycetota bacterium]